MQNIYGIIDKISFGSPTVLIEGESGTGKELTANVIHNNSDRKRARLFRLTAALSRKPFWKVNFSGM
jgi:DNA-binding NtrC family response regulator